jgi:hypothetical protein
MGKKARAGAAVRSGAAISPDELPVVAAREPCPCGSGKRFKTCHGKAAARAAAAVVPRPFEGLPGEADWIALREIVPAATAPLNLVGEHAGRVVTLATVLPMTSAALVRADGSVLLGLQVPGVSRDPSRDAAEALLLALAAEPGTSVPPRGWTGSDPAGRRLQDLLDPAAPLDVTVHDSFAFWLAPTDPNAAVEPAIAAALDRANAEIIPTARLMSVPAAYWCRLKERNHLRWVWPEPEDRMLDAMARLHVTGADSLGDGTRFVGSFRAYGVLVPVWDLRSDVDAAALEEPAVGYAQRLARALEDAAPLTTEQRGARAGLQTRQLTLR